MSLFYSRGFSPEDSSVNLFRLTNRSPRSGTGFYERWNNDNIKKLSYSESLERGEGGKEERRRVGKKKETNERPINEGSVVFGVILFLKKVSNQIKTVDLMTDLIISPN